MSDKPKPIYQMGDDPDALTYEKIKGKQGTGDPLTPEEVAIVAAHKGHASNPVEAAMAKAKAGTTGKKSKKVKGEAEGVDVADILESIFNKVLQEQQETVETMTPEEKAKSKKAHVKVLKVPSHLQLPKVPEHWSKAKKARTTAHYLLGGGHGAAEWTEDMKVERILLAHEWLLKALSFQMAELDPDSTVVKDYFAGKAKAKQKAAEKAAAKAAKKAKKIEAKIEASTDEAYSEVAAQLSGVGQEQATSEEVIASGEGKVNGGAFSDDVIEDEGADTVPDDLSGLDFDPEVADKD